MQVRVLSWAPKKRAISDDCSFFSFRVLKGSLDDYGSYGRKEKDERRKEKDERRKEKGERREFKEFREFREFRDNRLDFLCSNWVFRV